ncbi:MAG: DUF58 domain-containing protein [Spirochaetia bacterium]|jgi:uncharacterized protein (DUF58 family)|nr:DUF58 domain-containing protein [Spirochaetia bacterium]
MMISFDEVPTSIFFVFPVQVVLAVLLAIGLLLNIRELVIFSLVLTSLKFFTYLWSIASLKKVECAILPERYRLFPGEKLDISVNVNNLKILPVRIKIELFIHHSLCKGDPEATVSGRSINLEKTFMWFERSGFLLETFPSKRGVYNLGPPVITGCDIFSFNQRREKTGESAEIVVYPAVIEIKNYKLLEREYFGLHKGISPVKNPLLVSGTRDYQSGTPARNIHWKASARFDQLQAKMFESVRQEKVLIILDASGFKRRVGDSLSAACREDEDFEKTVQVIAAFILKLQHKDIPSGFVTNAMLERGSSGSGGSRIIPFSCSSRHHALILETLARLKPEASEKPDMTVLMTKGNFLSGNAGCICFAKNYSSGILKTADFLKARKIRARFIFAEKNGNDFPPGNFDYLDEIMAGGGGKS